MCYRSRLYGSREGDLAEDQSLWAVPALCGLPTPEGFAVDRHLVGEEARGLFADRGGFRALIGSVGGIGADTGQRDGDFAGPAIARAEQVEFAIFGSAFRPGDGGGDGRAGVAIVGPELRLGFPLVGGRHRAGRRLR